ncbi:hypothetical protein MKK84_14580 [Methylobacterium sp. E-065]|uniref:hypothetical protein n=1 Tax=Methylobacterium sp. E-065 TaxID=2836583 RepID=UPI001FBB291B|nr:hypothetical protein [Methylobacterium sp. E-065]MCJ2018648.1 hypothetical protein [Methylobacterium sp. E-065]
MATRTETLFGTVSPSPIFSTSSTSRLRVQMAEKQVGIITCEAAYDRSAFTVGQ